MELYHVLNRGVERRNLFIDQRDYVRFVHNLYEFNDTAPAGNAYKSFQNMDLRNPYFTRGPRERIVDIHGWCVMKNHYHLLLSERKNGGLTQFIRKLNVGYANYFNERYNRSGTLFQGRTQKKLIDSDAYFLYILHYIHLNPLDYLPSARNWREHRIGSASRALKHLESYRWSSFLDYCSTSNFPSILTTALFQEIFDNVKEETVKFLRGKEIDAIRSYILE